jgi:hypothetical protein
VTTGIATADAICCELATEPLPLPVPELEALLHRLSKDSGPGAAEAAASLRAFLPHAATLRLVWVVEPAWRLAVLTALAKIGYRSQTMEAFHRCLASIQPSSDLP